MVDRVQASSERIRDLELAARRFEAIVSSAQDAIVCIDRRGIVTLFNQAAERIFGYTKTDVLGKNVSMLMASPYREEHDDYLRRFEETAVAGAIGRIRKVHGRRKSGEIFPIELSVSEAGTKDDVTYAAIIRDVAERVAAEDAVRLSEARFEAFMANAPTMAFLRDEQGRHLFVNRVYEQFFRVTAREMQGKTGDDILPSQYVRQFHASDSLVLQGKQPLEIVKSLRGPEGAKRDWLVINFPVEIAPGRIAVGGVGIEITERRRAEQHLKLQLDLVRVLSRSRSIIEQPPEILRAVAEGLSFEAAEFWELDAEKTTLQLAMSWSTPGRNLSALIEAGLALPLAVGMGLPGRTVAEKRVILCSDVRSDPDFTRAREADQLSLRGACAVPIRVENEMFGVMMLFRVDTIEPDEELRSVLDSVGSQIGDHLRLERAERRVEELKRESEHRSRLADIGAVAARIVHDLGNPIAGMKLNAQLLVRTAEREGHSGMSDAANQILGSLEHFMGLLFDLKDFARSQRLSLREVQSGPFLHEIAQPWKAVADGSGVVFVVSTEVSMEVQLDVERMRRVLDNLLKNAIEATPEGGSVLVRASSIDASSRFSVEDSGCGIPEGLDVFRLFETTKPQGSGLGLSIAKEIVEAHGGTLHFERREPKGTSFHIDLPPIVTAGISQASPPA